VVVTRTFNNCSIAPGCKRIIVDPDYLTALHQPNIDLEWTGIQEIVEDGVVLKNGAKIPLDVIIFGTGFCLVIASALSDKY
jgi:cation diffusion facilitator CzcD-associated flavoprotein CzcO